MVDKGVKWVLDELDEGAGACNVNAVLPACAKVCPPSSLSFAVVGTSAKICNPVVLPE